MTGLQQRLLNLRIVTLAMLASLVVYGVVIAIAVPPPPADPNDAVTLALGAVAFAQIGTVFVIRYVLFGSLALRAPDDLRETATVEGNALEAAIGRAAGRYFSGTLIGLAIAESVAILGFVSAYLSGVALAYVPYAVGAAVLMGVQFPTTSGLLCLLTPPERVGARRAHRL